MNATETVEGTWIRKINGKLFLINFNEENFELIFELSVGTSLSMGQFSIDTTKTPAQLDLTLTDGIGKNGDRLRARSTANVVRAIVQHDHDTLKFFAPPPEEGGRPMEFPDADEGLVGTNLYLILKRANQ